jgi:hypothetical protein
MAKNNNNKKKALAASLLALSVVGIAGLSVAYFSDMVSESGIAHMGTLDLVSCDEKDEIGLAHYSMNDTPVEGDLAFNNVNPGDYITYSSCITNAGNKSAWVSPELTITVGEDRNNLTLTEEEILNKVQISSVSLFGSAKYFSLADLSANPALAGAINVDLSAYATDGIVKVSGINTSYVLQGQGAYAEKEEAKDGDTFFIVDTIGANDLKIKLSEEAGNDFQDRNVTFDIALKAIQYRNHPLAPTATEWAAVEPFSLNN